MQRDDDLQTVAEVCEKLSKARLKMGDPQQVRWLQIAEDAAALIGKTTICRACNGYSCGQCEETGRIRLYRRMIDKMTVYELNLAKKGLVDE